jgi:hypothetical protein
MKILPLYMHRCSLYHINRLEFTQRRCSWGSSKFLFISFPLTLLSNGSSFFGLWTLHPTRLQSMNYIFLVHEVYATSSLRLLLILRCLSLVQGICDFCCVFLPRPYLYFFLKQIMLSGRFLVHKWPIRPDFIILCSQEIYDEIFSISRVTTFVQKNMPLNIMSNNINTHNNQYLTEDTVALVSE